MTFVRVFSIAATSVAVASFAIFFFVFLSIRQGQLEQAKAIERNDPLESAYAEPPPAGRPGATLPDVHAPLYVEPARKDQ